MATVEREHEGWALNGRFDAETGPLRVDWQGIGCSPSRICDRDDAIGYYASTPAG